MFCQWWEINLWLLWPWCSSSIPSKPEMHPICLFFLGICFLFAMIVGANLQIICSIILVHHHSTKKFGKKFPWLQNQETRIIPDNDLYRWSLTASICILKFKCWIKEGLFLIDIYIEKKLFLDQELEELTIKHCKKATSICSKQFSLQVVLSQYMQIFCMLFYCIVKSWILGSEDWCVYNNTDQSYPWCMSRPTPGLLLLKKL